MPTMDRQWIMLQAIPLAPRKIDAAALHQALAARGCEVSLRAVQRDLVALSTISPIGSDDNRPTGWWWIRRVILPPDP